MVRQKSRKTIEELYAPGPTQPSLNGPRFDESFYQNSKPNKCNNKASDKGDACNNNAPNCRKKQKVGNTGVERKDEKTFLNEERLLGKTSKSRKPDHFMDNKNLSSFVEEPEKDEDTEEFFELIKETVENAVEKTISDVLNRNFREIHNKIEDIREHLNANEAQLEKLQADMNNKVIHYGEENSRHFRYLCMKSEYDKMFYQHQNIMTSVPVDARPNIINPYPMNFANVSPAHHQNLPCHPKEQGSAPDSQKNPHSDTPTQHCNCHMNGFGDYSGVDRSKSSVSTKSSEMGIKEIKDLLEQLQKFYEHQQPPKKQQGKETHENISLDMQDESADEDDSSDVSSSPSIAEKLGGGGDS